MTIEELLRFFDIRAPKVQKLEGYNSTNYKITHTKEIHYVLKHYADPAELPILKEEIDFVNRIKGGLAFQLSETIERNGKSIHHHSDGTYSRLLTYIEGQLLSEVNHSPSLLYDFGKSAALLDVALKDIRAPIISSQKMIWDVQHAMLNQKKIQFIKEPNKRKLVNYFFDQFEHFALPKLQGLRQQIIHNDLNDRNVLCHDDKVVGFIDFGDASDSQLINELAIALTFVMMDNKLALAAACEVISGYCSILQLNEDEVSLLPYLIPVRLCISVCNSAKAKSEATDTEYILISEQGAWYLLGRWIAWNPILIRDSFLRASGFQGTDTSSVKQKMAKSRELHFCAAQGLSYSTPIYMSGAAFQYMYDMDGNAYLDAYNNIPHVGHSHPRISQSVSKQIRKLNTNSRYHNESLHSYAEKLLNRLPDHLNKMFFVNSGTEANALAQRLAKVYTGNGHQIVMDMGYHGHTSELIEISAYKYNGPGGHGKQDHICELPLPKLYKGKFNSSADYLAEAKKIIDLEVQKGAKFSSFITESICGCGGQVPLAKGYLKELVPYLQEKGIVCISDEVQIGFGRLGRWFWGFEMQEFIPDIVVLGKPMGNGFPIGAVLTTQAICDSFENGMDFFSSFGGNPLVTESAHAVLEVLEEEKLQHHAMTIGDQLKFLLNELKCNYPIIGDVRGEGLFLGIEFTNVDGTPGREVCNHVKNKLKENYILTGTDGKFGETLKIKPPLCFSKDNADYLVDNLEKVLRSYTNR